MRDDRPLATLYPEGGLRLDPYRPGRSLLPARQHSARVFRGVAALVLHELVHWRQMFGMVLVLVAIGVVQMADRGSEDAMVVAPIE
jgi:hypothetical protein